MPYYDDDGTEIDPSTIPMPALCKRCEKQDEPHEKILCDLTRIDQADEPEFRCGAFVSLYGVLDDVILD